MKWLKKIIEAVITWFKGFYRKIEQKYSVTGKGGRTLQSPRDLTAVEVEAFMKSIGLEKGGTKVIRRHIIFRGRVQGVGFRYQAYQAANQAGVTGWVRNNTDGSVEMEAQGTDESISRMLLFIERSSWISIRDMEMTSVHVRPEEKGFRVTGY